MLTQKTKLFNWLAILLIGGLLFASFPAAKVSAATLTVCASGCDYTSIQDAINAAAVGDTVQVAAGTYSESLGGWRDLEIKKSISLIGAGSGQTIVELTDLQNGLEIEPDGTGNVTVEGFTFTKETANDYSADFAVRAGQTAGHFNSLVFRDVEVAFAEAQNLLFQGVSTYGSIELDGVIIHDGGVKGFTMQGTAANALIKNSSFNHNGYQANTCTPNDACQGNGFNFEDGTITGKMTIEDTEFKDNQGIGLNLLNAEHVEINDIEVSGNHYGVILNVWGSQTAGDIEFNNPNLTGNSINGLYMLAETGSTLDGVTVAGGIINGNTLNDVHIYGNTDASIKGEIKNIKINGVSPISKLLVWEAQTQLVDAEMNWWGSPLFSVVKERALGSVDYSPWCKNPACTSKVWYITGGAVFKLRSTQQPPVIRSM